MINRVTLLGNLGRDPEIRHLENGAAVVKFSMATNENYKDKNGEWQQQTEWHEVVMWRNLAERAAAQLKKGGLVYIEGKLTHREYTDKEGNKRYRTEVVAAMFRNLEKRENSGQGGTYFPSADDAPSDKTKTASADAAAPTNTAAPVSDEVNDDLPF